METSALELFFSIQWEATVDRHKAALDVDDLETTKNYGSWNSIQTNIFRETPQSLSLIQPALEHLSVFTEFFAKKLTAFLDPQFFWGALGCLLQLVAESDDSEVLTKVPWMIKQLVLQIEAFDDFWDVAIEVRNPVREACFDMQLLYLDFHISCIRYLHGDDEVTHGGGRPVQLIEKRFAAIKQDLEQALERVERALQSRSSRVQAQPSTAEVVTAAKFRCLMQPDSRPARIFDRVDIFEKLDSILAPEASRSFKSVALYGMGGVGKSTVASTYLMHKYDDKSYDVLLWAHGEKSVSLKQSFTDIALRLKLPEARPQNHDENLILVQDWFQTTDSRWLIVYDNVDDASTVMRFWPGSSQGRVIITTRNRSLAFDPAAEGLEIPTWDAQTGSDFLFFLLKENIGRDLDAETSSALALSQKLSGHALALFHMAAVIHDGGFSIQKFMTMYLRNPRRAHTTDSLSGLWGYSFKSLDEESMNLIGVLSYLEPDIIPQDIFENSENRSFPEELEFCTDEFAFSAALSKLLKLALVKKDRDTGHLSMHRMVQAQLKQFLDHDSRQRCFNNAVELLFEIFPREEVSQAQLYDRWELCNRYVQHVLHIKECFVEESRASKKFKSSWEFCALLTSCERFLSETNALSELEALAIVNLEALNKLEDSPRKFDLKASILSHQAQAAESLGRPIEAIALNQQCYNLRLQEVPQSRTLLCFTSNNIAYCHNTANLHEKSEEWYETSKSYWDMMVKDGEETRERPARHIKNHARCLVYLGKYEEAADMFDVSIPRLMSEKPLNWAMLAYGLFAQATMHRRQQKFNIAEAQYFGAQNTWVKGDQTRAHPFYAACLYKIGVCCLDQGKIEAAIKHLRDSLEVTKVHKADRPAEHGRSLLKLGEALLHDGLDKSRSEAATLRNDAEIALRTAKADVVRCDNESVYDEMIAIFWR